MPGFFVEKKYKKNKIKFIYSNKLNTWYISRNTIIEILYNPISPSSYWGNLRKKYLKQNIDINKFLTNIKCKGKDNKKRIQKVFSLQELKNFLILTKNYSFIIYLKKISKDLDLIILDINLKSIIYKNLKLYKNKKDLTDKIISIIKNY